MKKTEERIENFNYLYGDAVINYFLISIKIPTLPGT